ncbi:MAG TPA: hypothetical protein VEW04_08830 [Allosphingosinicella sp.]|nr:hypothetical protein [Allosphingosinicella sp.]
MRKLGLATLLALAGCHPPETNTSMNQAEANAAVPVASPPEANVVAGPTRASAAPDPAVLADFSPSQRRAYERGFADCAAGRYDPERGPEAYRLGCAAANDR